MNKMAKLLLLVFAAFLLTFGTRIDSAQAADTKYGVVANVSAVTVRSQPKGEGTKVGSYTRGTWAKIFTENSGYYYVEMPDGKLGYIRSSYVDINSASNGLMAVVKDCGPNGFLNLRVAPGTNASIAGHYRTGTPCRVLEKRSDGWSYVNVNGLKGYFMSKYLNFMTIPASSSVAYVNISSGTVNLRSAPRSTASKTASLANHSYVVILQKGNGWWKVSTMSGKVGYVDPSNFKSGVIGGGKRPSASDLATPAPTNKNDKNDNTTTKPAENKDTVNTSKPYGIVKASLNFRTSPNSSATIIAQLAKGTKVTVVAPGQTWTRIKANGKTGYVMTKYLTLKNTTSSPKKTVTQANKSYVNLRKSASKNSTVLSQVKHGTVVTVLVPDVNGWTQVKYGNKTGYMMTQYLK